jgi:hypothetical protein
MLILDKDKSHAPYPICFLSNVSFLYVWAKILSGLSLLPVTGVAKGMMTPLPVESSEP